MSWGWYLAFVIVVLLVSGGIFLATKLLKQLAKNNADSIEAEANRQAELIINQANSQSEKSTQEIWQKWRELTEQLEAFSKREANISAKEERLILQQTELDERAGELEQIQAEIAGREAALLQKEKQIADRLSQLAGMTPDQAKEELLKNVEQEARLDAVKLARNIEQQAQAEAEQKAQRIIVTAMQRISTEQTSQAVVTTVSLPNEELKGRIIGKDGRNIRSFEQVTGVNVMIDDTPGSVLLSSFDPVRREIARATLEELIADGRIHPARIEQAYQRNVKTIEQTCIREAEDALARVGIADLDPGLLPYLGALRFRTSYGQNVLAHSIESAKIAAAIAAEIGANVETCKRSAFLHDIGKAVTHEVEGSHAQLGAQLAKRFNEADVIVHAIAAHHDEIALESVEDLITQIADSISGARPGARRESLEAYVRRLSRLEEIAVKHPGVQRVFAMQAGREVRVMVEPSQISDAQCQMIAKQIAKQIEAELTYPGNIKVTVIRESRAVETAH